MGPTPFIRHADKFFAGAGAGLTAVTLTYPLDTIRARLAFQITGEHKYTGIWHTATSILKDEGGVRALYRGFVPTLMGMVPYAGLSFYCFEVLKYACMKYSPNIACNRLERNTGLWWFFLEIPTSIYKQIHSRRPCTFRSREAPLRRLCRRTCTVVFISVWCDTSADAVSYDESWNSKIRVSFGNVLRSDYFWNKKLRKGFWCWKMVRKCKYSKTFEKYNILKFNRTLLIFFQYFQILLKYCSILKN